MGVVRKMSKQYSFSTLTNKYKRDFGGAGLTSNPKTKRPLSTKEDIHLVLKSHVARGRYSLIYQEKLIIALAHSLGAKIGVKVKDIVVMSNHVHLKIKILSRRAFHSFIKAFTSLIVRRIFKIKRNASSSELAKIRKFQSGFFSGRPFTRIIARGKRCFRVIQNYFELNALEKKGINKAQGRALLAAPSTNLSYTQLAVKKVCT